MSAPLRVSRRRVLAPAVLTASLAAVALSALLVQESRHGAPALPPAVRSRSLAAAPADKDPVALPLFAPAPGSPELPPWRDDFSRPGGEWVPFAGGAPRETIASIEAGLLALSVDARGCDPARVHAVGVARRSPAQAGSGLVARLVLEWCPPPNASGRSAGLTLTCTDPLAGHGVAGLDPALQEPAVTFEVIGVPPGQAARLQATAHSGGLRTPLYLDGWPAKRGRTIERVELEVEWSPRGVAIRADGRELSRASEPALRPSDRVWVLVHAASHAGFEPRPVRVREVALVPLGRTS